MSATTIGWSFTVEAMEVDTMGMEIQLTNEPVEVRVFPKGRFEVFQVGPMTIGRASYEPGWRWATDVGGSEDALCQVEHVGWVVSGRAAVKMADGSEHVM